MSSLAAARADNFYYPKNWDPSKGSINKFQKSHPLGARAKHIQDGILIVRFEMPFNVWCTSCEEHIGKGVRFNAKKKQVGKYHTTPIYEFRLTCATCKAEMIVENDPEHRTYAMKKGIRQKIETFESEDNVTEALNDTSIGQKLQDPFYRLQHAQEDQAKAKQLASGLERLQERQEKQHGDSYASNASLRSSFRTEKKRIRSRDAHARSCGVDMPLLEATTEDIKEAQSKRFDRPSRFRQHAKRQRLELQSESIFGQDSSTRKRNLKALATAKRLKIQFSKFAP